MTEMHEPPTDLLAELAARSEFATAADRELDAEIRCALTGIEYPTTDTLYGRLMRQVRKDCAQCYTGSLDAALLLIPEGWEYSFTNCNGYDEATLTNHTMQRTAWSSGSSLALAITAAALRAHHTLNLENARGIR